MTTIAQARETIYQAFLDGTSLATAVIAFANEKFTPPTDAPWARLVVNQEAAADTPTLGPVGERKFSRNGRVLIQLYDAVDNGLSALDVLALETRNIFEGKTISSLNFITAEIRETGSDGEWYQFVVDAPFDYYETK